LNHCRNCKHWERRDAEGLGFGVCLLAQNRNGWNPPDHETLAFVTAENPRDTFSNLRCDPNFGCVQWEENEEGQRQQ
jgi:hypothetical protein